MIDDRAILEAISKEDEKALVELMSRYREKIFRLSYRYVGNPVDAANLTEEVFTKIYFSAIKYRPTGSASSWIYTIAANLCRDFLRSERRRQHTVSLSSIHSAEEETTPLSERIASGARDAAQSTESSEQLAHLQQAIRSLPEKLRFPFIYCVLEGNSHQSAAEILKTTSKTVESRIYRARKQLQAVLEAGV